MASHAQLPILYDVAVPPKPVSRQGRQGRVGPTMVWQVLPPIAVCLKGHLRWWNLGWLPGLGLTWVT